jgi:TolB protein
MEQSFQQKYRLDRDRLRYVAHVVADDIIGLYNNGIRGSNASTIAFVVKSGRNKELYLIDPDGENLRQITFSRTLNMSPSWSPDGSRIVYSSLTRRQWVISMINVNTGQISTISRWPGLNSAPAFCPSDPDLISFASSRDGNVEVYSCRTRGSGLRRLTRHYAIDTTPTWSPSGKQIAFVSERGGLPKIYIMNDNGSNVRRLTKTIDTFENSPNWSPRGDRIAFVVMHGNIFDIATSDLYGEDVMILTYGSGSNENPRWSPDGLKIVFSSTRRGGKNLFIMNWDGTNVRQLTRNGLSSSPAWAPTSSGDDIRL